VYVCVCDRESVLAACFQLPPPKHSTLSAFSGIAILLLLPLEVVHQIEEIQLEAVVGSQPDDFQSGQLRNVQHNFFRGWRWRWLGTFRSVVVADGFAVLVKGGQGLGRSAASSLPPLVRGIQNAIDIHILTTTREQPGTGSTVGRCGSERGIGIGFEALADASSAVALLKAPSLGRWTFGLVGGHDFEKGNHFVNVAGRVLSFFRNNLVSFFFGCFLLSRLGGGPLALDLFSRLGPLGRWFGDSGAGSRLGMLSLFLPSLGFLLLDAGPTLVKAGVRGSIFQVGIRRFQTGGLFPRSRRLGRV